jgi:hypothetical protein
LSFVEELEEMSKQQDKQKKKKKKKSTAGVIKTTHFLDVVVIHRRREQNNVLVVYPELKLLDFIQSPQFSNQFSSFETQVLRYNLNAYSAAPPLRPRSPPLVLIDNSYNGAASAAAADISVSSVTTITKRLLHFVFIVVNESTTSLGMLYNTLFCSSSFLTTHHICIIRRAHKRWKETSCRCAG